MVNFSTSFKKAVIGLATVLLFVTAEAQNVTVAGANTGNGSYATLGAAITAIGTSQAGANITVSITANTTETATVSIGAGTWTTLKIQPSGGAARTISGSLAAALIDLNGADNVTIDGLNTGGNSLTVSNTSTVATSGTCTIRFAADATNNTITNTSVLGSATMAIGTNGGNIYFATGTTTGNDNNTISNCNIGPAGTNLPSKLIYGNGSTGSSAAANSGITITNCNLYDFYLAGGCAGVHVLTGNTDWTITNNRVYQTASRAPSSSTFTAINFTNATFGNNVQITGNVIGYSGYTSLTSVSSSGTTVTVSSTASLSAGMPVMVTSGTGAFAAGTTIASITNSTQFVVSAAPTTALSGATIVYPTGTFTVAGSSTAAFQGIVLTALNTAANTCNVNNNIISDISFTSGSGAVEAIKSATTSSSSALNINNNIIRNIAVPTSTGAINLINTGSTYTTTVNGNTISNISRTGSGNTYGILMTSSNTYTINNNTISSIALNNTSGTGDLYGIYGISSAVNVTANNNSITSLTTTSTSTPALGGIYENGVSGNKVFQGNTISTITAAAGSATITGIWAVATSSNPYDISNNTLTGFTGGKTLYGIYYNSSSTTANIYKNKIADITTSVSGVNVILYGIYINAGTTNNIYNNIIGNLSITAGQNSNGSPMSGIFLNAGTTNNVYFNTVYIGATTTTGTPFYSAALYTATTPTLDMRNNILVNLATPKGSLVPAAAYYRLNTTLTTYASTSNNNLLYAGTPSSLNLIYYDGSNSDQTLSAFKTRVSTRDAVSVSENPTWVSTVGSNAAFLHINTSTATQIESSGAPISGFTTDFDGDTRNTSTPDIGADEMAGVALDLTGPSITYTTLSTPICAIGNRVLSATITDPSGVPTTGSGLPVLYWKIASGSYTAATGVWNSSTSKYDFTFGAGATTGQTVSYYIAAQDNASTPNVSVSPSAGAATFTASPPAAGTAPTSPSTYSLVTPFGGTYTVGSGGNYTTITAAVAAYNAATCFNDNVVFSLTGTTYNEAGAMTINANAAAGSYTLTIKPTQAATTITASAATAVFVLNGVDNVVIDGSINTTTNTVCPSSAATRNLTINNTSVSTSSAVIWLQTASSNGTTGNVIKNCNLNGNAVTTTIVGIGSGSSTISTSSTGTGNNNNQFINNNITNTQYGIFSQGNSTTKNTGTVINQNQINTSAGMKGGILVGYEDGVVISGNSISNISQGTASTTDVFGISCGLGTSISSSSITGNDVVNAVITNNNIGAVTQAGTYSAMGIGIASVASGTTLVANNVISGVASNATGADFTTGILLGGGAGSVTQVYYNTVSMQGTMPGSTSGNSTTACLSITSTTSTNSISLRNNILSNTQVGNTSATTKFCAIATAQSTFTNFTSSYNDFYCAGAGPGTYNLAYTAGIAGTARATLSAWNTATGQDAASVSKNVAPVFVSSTDLHLDAANLSNGTNLESTGTPVSVTTDFDCATRNATTPDIGADEFTYVAPSCVVPTTLSASSIGYQQATVSWVAPSTGSSPVGYNWEVRTSGAGGSGATGLTTSGSTTAPTVSVTVSSLTIGTSYNLYVQTDCGSGSTSTWAGPYNFSTLSCNVPTGLASSSVTASSANLAWVAPATGSPLGYQWEVRSSGTGGSGATGLAASGSTTAPTVSASTSALQPSTTYTLYVRTQCTTIPDYSAWAASSTFTTPAIPMAYDFSAGTGTYTAITTGGGATAASGFGTAFDNATPVAVTLSPAFTFNGTSYTNMYLTSNGFITLGATAPSSSEYNPISSTATYNAAISPFGQDLSYSGVSGSSPSVLYQYQSGTSEWVVQWQDVGRYSFGGSADRISFQVRMNTSDGTIKFVYGGTITVGTSTNTMQVGLRGAYSVGNYPSQVVNRTTDVTTSTALTLPWDKTTYGTTASSSMQFTSTTSPAAGTIYTFTPITCQPFPTPAAATSVTASGATANWTANGAANGYLVRWRKATDALSVSTWATPTAVAGSSSNSYAITGLSSSTPYVVEVAASCGAGNNSTFGPAISFTTAATPCVAPVAQASALAFSNVLSTSLTGTITPNTPAADGYLVIRTAFGATAPTQPVNATTYSSANISGLGTGLTFVQTGSTVTFNQTGLTANTSYTYYVFAYNNTSCAGGPVYSTATVLSASQKTCTAAPTALAAGSITNNSAVITWTDPTGAASYNLQYRINGTTTWTTVLPAFGSGATYTLSGLSPNTTYDVQVAAPNSACGMYAQTLSLFTTTAQPMAYDFSASTGTYTAITTGGGATAASGFGTTFDDATPVAVTLSPAFTFNGTSYSTMNISSNGFITLGATAPSSSEYNPISSTATYNAAIAPFGQDLKFSAVSGAAPAVLYQYASGTNEWIVQWQDIGRYHSTSAGSNDRISFQVRMNTSDGTIKFVYGGTIVVGTSSTNTVQVGLRGAYSVGNYPSQIVNRTTDVTTSTALTLPWDKTTYGTLATSSMQFTSTTSPAAGTIYTFTPITCQPFPTPAAATSVTANGATAKWTANGAANGYLVRWRKATDALSVSTWATPTAVAGSSSNSYAITGLSSSTPYVVEVAASCGAGNNSTFGPAISFTTAAAACVAPVAQATALNFSSITTTTLTGTITPNTPAADGYLVIRTAFGATAPTQPVNATTYSAANISGLGTGLTFVQTGSTLTFNQTGLTANGNYTYYVFAYNNTSCSGGPVYSTAAVLNASQKTCTAAPTALAASSVTSNSAVITWTDPAGAASYTLQYRVNGTTTWTTVTPTFGSGSTYTLTGLSSTTAYDVQVQAPNSACGTYVQTTSLFTTTCPAPAAYAALPYTQDFEGWINGCNTSDVPDAYWRNTPVSGSNSWRRNDQGVSAAGWGTSSGSYSPASTVGTYSARFHSFGAASGLTGALDLYVDCSSSTNTKTLKFDYVNIDGGDFLGVYVSTNGAAGPFNQLGTNLTTNLGYTTQTFTLTSNSATTVIRLLATSDFGNTDIGVDNLNITVNAPIAISSISATQQTANLFVNTSSNDIMMVNVATTGNAGGLNLNTLKVTSANTADSDFGTVKLWGGASATSSSHGSTVLASGTFSGGVVNFTGLSQALVTGNNYFWVTYDVLNSAVAGHVADLKIAAGDITFTPTSPSVATGTQPVALLDPAGNRPIVGAMCGTTYTINNTLPTAGLNYNNFTDAVNDLNQRGLSCAVVFNVKDGQTFNEKVPAITTTGTVTNTITFQRDNTGASRPTLVGTTGTGTADAVVQLNGVDYLRWDGINIADNAANANNTTRFEYGVFMNALSGNGCKNNIIKNSNISLTTTNTSTRGVFTQGNSVAGGNNSNNQFLSLQVSNVVWGYDLEGATTGTYDDNNEINNTGSGTSTISNIGSTANSGTYGVVIGYQTNFKLKNTTISNMTGSASANVFGFYASAGSSSTMEVSGNTISGVTLTGSTASLVRGVSITTSASATVSNNIIRSLSADGFVSGIYNMGGVLTATGNVIGGSGTGITSTGSGGYATGINCFSSAADGHQITGNNISYIVANGGTSASVDGILVGSSNCLISGNTVQNMSANGNSLSTSDGIYVYASSVAGTVVTGNTISNCSVSSACDFNAIEVEGGGTNVNTNTISNISSSGTGFLTAINVLGNNAVISGNTITNVSASSSSGVWGVYTAALSTTISGNTISYLNTSTAACSGIVADAGGNNVTIRGNTIKGLVVSTAGSSVVAGAIATLGTGTNLVEKNVIDSIITNASTGAFALGIRASGTSNTTNIFNNMISGIRANSANGGTACPVRAISIESSASVKLYHNTIYLTGTSTNTGFVSATIYSTTSGLLDSRNNILYNAYTGSGSHTVIYFTSSVTTYNTNLNASSNNNLMYAGTPGTNNLILLPNTGGNKQTLADYVAALTSPKENASFTLSTIPFVSTTSPVNLHIDLTSSTLCAINNKGVQITSTPTVPDDIDAANVRSTTPDVGADEWVMPTPNAGTVTVSANPVCTGAITMSVTGQVTGSEFTAQWQRDAGSGYVAIDGTTDGGTYTNFTTTTLNITSVTGKDGYKYRYVVTRCTPTVATGTSNEITMSVNCNSVWQGDVVGSTTDWFNPGNWSTNMVPSTCADNVTIPTSPSGGNNFPVISGASAQVGNITVQAGASINIDNARTLSVCGDFTGSSTTTAATVTGAGKVVLTGSTAQAISGRTTFTTLHVTKTGGSTATVQSGSTVDVTTALELESGNLTNSGALTLKSTATTHAIFNDFGAPVGTYTGTYTGSINEERYYRATSANSYNQHYMGSPVANATLAQFGAGGSSGAVTPTPDCSETQLASTSVYGSVFSYSEASGASCPMASWTVKANSAAATPAQGYSVAKTGAGVLTVSGTPNTATSYAVAGLTNSNWTKGTLQHPSTTAFGSGWHMVSNPYNATLDLTSITPPAGFDNQIQVWDVIQGQYYTLTGTKLIAPFQAFFVHKTSPGGSATYTIDGNWRTATPATFYAQSIPEQLTITATNTANQLYDVATVGFNSDATDQFDPQFDANKLTGSIGRHNLSTQNNGYELNTNILHSITETSTVNLTFEPGSAGTYTLTFDGLNSFDPTSYIMLEDKQLNTMHDVRSGDYTFSATAQDNWNRFVLHFTPKAEIATTDQQCETLGTINVTQPGTANWNYTITDNQSNTIASGTLNETTPIAVNTPTGTYTLTLTDNNNYQVVKTVTVNGTTPIVAVFSPSTTTTTTNTDVAFNSTTTATDYYWDFGDGTTATGQNAIHSYGDTGTYTVSLIVISANGCSNTTTQTVTVNAEVQTGLNNLNNNQNITIWSNGNTVYVDFSRITRTDATIEIYNVLGQQLVNEKFGRSSIFTKAIGNIEAAYVIVKVKQGEATTTKKVLIGNTR